MMKNARGVTLTELMVSTVIISVGILGFFGAFTFITKSLYVSRTGTLATNLAQERIEALKNLSYYELLITTSASSDTNFSPALDYDNTNYAPETISIGGVNFTRYTFVSLAQIDNDVVTQVAYTYPDTGMKQVTVHVIWTDRGSSKKWTLTNLLENPNVNPLDSSLQGTVNKASGGALAGAVVIAEENPDWNALSDASGGWTFRVYHGSYTIRASSAGYFDAVSSRQQAISGSNTNIGILELTPISSGTVAGNAWLSTNVVISQVVASTAQADQSNFIAQYVELFNPTTAAITIGGATPPIKLNFDAPNTCSYSATCADSTYGMKLTYVNNTIAAGGYYLIANTATFTVNGTSVAADAYYADDADTYCTAVSPPYSSNLWQLSSAPPRKMLLNPGHGGTVWLSDSAGTILDAVGWSHGAQYGSYYESAAVSMASGFQANNQLVRFSTPAATLAEMTAYGNSYDSNKNSVDLLLRTPIDISARNTTSSTKTVVAGVPALGAFVSAGDLNSGSTQTWRMTASSGSMSHPYATYRLEGVSTGTWTVVIATAGYYAQIDTVTVAQGQTTSIPSSSTEAPWTVADNYSAFLSTPSVGGFVSGIVTNVSNSPLSGIKVQAGGTTKTTGVNGAYFAAVTSGTVYITANPNNQNPAYVAQTVAPTITEGQVYTQDFTLSGGGVLQGYLTTGTTPLPNYVVVARIGGSQQGTGVSGTSGYFYIRNLATGTYTVAPALEVGQDSSPNSIDVTVVSGQTVFVGTFTVSGAFGSIAGTITNSGTLVTSGALLLASASAIPSSPAAIAGSSAPALTPMYAVSSKADGTYVLPVRGANTYYLSAYIPSINPDNSVSVTTKTYSGIYVSPSVTTTQTVTLP